MMRILGTIFAGLLGLAFGSFLNVCLSRWPAGESVVEPRSHCRNCSHTLSWWENIPLFSWIALRGRCRECRSWIGLRYPLVELSVGTLWMTQSWILLGKLDEGDLLGLGEMPFAFVLAELICAFVFSWFMVALATLDAENLWLPDWITLSGIGIGFLLTLCLSLWSPRNVIGPFGAITIPDRTLVAFGFNKFLGIVAAAGLILLIRWVYWLVRHREGMGLGDAKLMALLAAWLGLPGALLAFVLGVVLGAVIAVFQLALPSAKRDTENWALSKLPLGTFLCTGGIVSSLWGEQIIAVYRHWAGF